MSASSGLVDPVNLSGNADIDALLWGWRWDTSSISYINYTFPTSTVPYAGYTQIVSFSAFNGSQILAVLQALTNVMSFANLQFNLVAPDSTTGVTLRWAEATQINYTNDSDVATHTGLHNIGTAEANMPELGYNGTAPYSAYHAQGDAWFNPNNYNDPVPGSFQYAAGIFHETGHNLGLKHGHESETHHGVTFPALPADHDSFEFTVMTYRQFPGDDLSKPGFDNAPDHPTTFMMNDIAALQYLYGANYNYNNTDTVYYWNPTTGEMSINSAAQGAPQNNHVFMTIWDGGGIDTYNFADYTSDLSVSLAPGGWTSLGSAYRPDLGNDGPGTLQHYARGNIFNARLFQGNPASMIENAIGGSGNDTISGTQFNNVLQGLAGDDLLFGLNGNDVLASDQGNDTLKGGGGADGLYGGPDDDNLIGGEDADTLNGGAGVDWASYAGSPIAVIINLGTGFGQRGDAHGDTLFNIENLIGSSYADGLLGGPENNTFRGGAGADTLDGGAGLDTADYSDSNVAVTIDLPATTGFGGTAEGDRLFGIENVIGSGRGDTIIGNASIPNMFSGGPGDDRFTGGEASDRLSGSEGADLLVGLGGADVLLGEGGSDTLNGGTGNDRLLGQADADRGFGGDGNDLLIGGSGKDFLRGDSGADTLIGARGDDSLEGGDGNDNLLGGLGRDLLEGGAGRDLFDFNRISDSLPGRQRDSLIDFTQREDHLDLASIDAIRGGGNDAFTFIGSERFSDTAGELRERDANGRALVTGDVNGDGVADFEIALFDVVDLAARDFVL